MGHYVHVNVKKNQEKTDAIENGRERCIDMAVATNFWQGHFK
jgi:hypothetical protein